MQRPARLRMMLRMIALKVQLDADRLAAFCQKWRIAEFSVFGSVLRADFRPDSDVDCLVTFEEGASHSFEDWASMEGELKAILGRRADLVERRLVEQSENYIRRGDILRTAELLYAAR